MDERRRTRAEVSFHAALAMVVAPIVTLPIVWALAIFHRKRAEDPEERRWARRLVLVAIVDTFVALSAASYFAFDLRDQLAELDRPPPRIGVMLEDARGGVRVREVIPGSPADLAGLRSGDVIVRARGHAVSSVRSLLDQVEHGDAIDVSVERSGAVQTLRVVPSRNVAAPRTARCTAAPTSRASPWDLAPYALFGLGAIVLWVIGRRRGVRQWTTWIPLVFVLVLMAIASSIGIWLACAIAGGAPRATAIGLFTSELVAVSAALLWLFLRGPSPVELADAEPRWSFWRTYPTALLYAGAWMLRVAWLLPPLLVVSAKLGVGRVSPELSELLESGTRDPIYAALFFLSAAVLAPIAEETLFRGILMPHLARTISPWAALYSSAVLFGLLHVSHGVMLIGPLVLGCVLGWARLRSRGLATPIALHITFNAFVTLTSWFGR